MRDNVSMVWDGVAYKCTPLVLEGAFDRVVSYAQQDERWKADRLAGTTQTIGGSGCAMVCACMVYTQVDQSITPKLFNIVLGNNSGYNIVYGSQAHLAWDRLPQIYPRLKWVGRKTWKRLLDDGELADVFARIDDAPLILWVDFYPATSKMDTHFVLAVDHSGDDIEIIDPWEGVRAGLLERYGQATGASLRRDIWGYRQLVVE